MAPAAPAPRPGPASTAPPAQLCCPHCGNPVDEPFAASRCPTCRLVVGAGRAQPRDRLRAVSAGTSAGVRVNAVRRSDAVAADPAEVTAALRDVAVKTGVGLGRLRMLDYDAAAERPGAELPGLAVVLVTFGSWKAARLAAGRET